jgi:hypothetical protein
MKTKRWLGVMILGAWLTTVSAGVAQSSNYQTYPPFAPPAPLQKDAVEPTAPVQATSYPGGLSDWILYRRDCCEGRHGNQTPLYIELYLESGVVYPMHNTLLGSQLHPGWTIAGGARALFFNEPMTAAWVFDGHIFNIDQWGGRQHTGFPVTVFQAGQKHVFGVGAVPGATVEDYNRAGVGVGFGRDWFPWRPANADGCSWRIGFDGGGRYASGRVNLDQLGHLNATVGSIYTGFHSDVEIPCRRVIWHIGIRGEWSYNWSSVLQQSSDVQDLSLLFTTGIRY